MYLKKFMQHFFTPQELEQDFQIINAMPQGEGAIGFSVLNNAFFDSFQVCNRLFQAVEHRSGALVDSLNISHWLLIVISVAAWISILGIASEAQ